MLHHIPKEKLGPQADEMTGAIGACVHCGFCLPTCPTYVLMGEEMDSPRGRIFLMKEVFEGQLSPGEAQRFIDNCLGCQACVTACPSGVHYGDLVSPYRAWAEERRARTLSEKLQRALLLQTLPFPSRFRVALALSRYARPVRQWLPEGISAMLAMAPESIPKAESLLGIYPPIGKRRSRVALLAGCAQQVLRPQINRAAIRVLRRHGVEVLVPEAQACCGALAMHIGAEADARTVARRNLFAFPEDVDAIISTAAGCGSGMKEYGLLFKGKPEERQARAFAAKVKDISLFLNELGFAPPGRSRAANRRVVYHDACHLAHAQQVTTAPRHLLTMIPGLTLLEPAEWELCCGSAGTYNIEHPETAEALGERKVTNLLAMDPEVVATGNIGCIMQIEKHLRAADSHVPVFHTIELLDEEASE